MDRVQRARDREDEDKVTIGYRENDEEKEERNNKRKTSKEVFKRQTENKREAKKEREESKASMWCHTGACYTKLTHLHGIRPLCLDFLFLRPKKMSSADTRRHSSCPHQ